MIWGKPSRTSEKRNVCSLSKNMENVYALRKPTDHLHVSVTYIFFKVQHILFSEIIFINCTALDGCESNVQCRYSGECQNGDWMCFLGMKENIVKVILEQDQGQNVIIISYLQLHTRFVQYLYNICGKKLIYLELLYNVSWQLGLHLNFCFTVH